MMNGAMMEQMEHASVALFTGIQANNSDMVRCSIDRSIDPSEIKYNDDSSLFHYAVYRNNAEIIKEIIPYTKNINVTDANGKTPLLLAVEKNSEVYNKVQALNNNDNPEMKSYEQVVKQGHEIIENLLDAGADISIADNEGANPVFVAISKNNIPLINCLLQKGLSKDPKCFTMLLCDSLHLATRLNLKEVIQILLETYSINVDIESSSGKTALQIAIEMGYVDLVEYLLDKGANVRGNNDDFHKLNKALTKKCEDKTDENANKDVSDADATVTETNTPNLLEFVLDKTMGSVDVIDIPRIGLTPLHVAVQNNRLEIAKILLEHGAEVDVVIPNQSSPLLTAIINNYSEMTELLLKKGADPNEMVNNDMGLFSCYVIHCAVSQQNLNIVHMLVENGAKVNSFDRSGNSPLSLAIRLGLHDLADYFLSIGAFVEYTKSTVQPIHVAISIGDMAMVKKLLRHGANVEITNEEGKTPLYLAVENNNIGLVHCLIQAGANVNVEYDKNAKKLSPLHLATINNNVEMAKLLITLGARCCSETSPIFLAIATNNIELFNLYWANRCTIEGPESKSFWEKNNIALHWAIRYGQIHMVKFFCGLDGNINMPDCEGYSPLFQAMLKHNDEIIKYLVKEGVPINDPSTAKRYKQWMPLHLAAYCGNLAWVKLFIQYGASIFATTKNHMSPLWLAVKRGHLDVTKCLLEHRADVHCRNTSRYHNGDTPLHLAIQNRRLDIVKLLLQYKANINHENNSHRSPLAAALYANDIDIAKYLLTKGAQIYTPSSENQLSTPLIHIAVALNEKSLVKLLFQYGASVDDVDSNGKTPLAVAIERGHVKMVKYLLKSGADVNAAHRLNGQIAVRTLFLAISGRHSEIVKQLLKHSVDVNVDVNTDYYKPLHMAITFGYTEIVEMLLNDNKIDLDALNGNGMSGLHLAIHNEYNDIAELLIEFGASVEIKNFNGLTPLDYCKDGKIKKFYNLYSIKEHCLILNDKDLTAFIMDNVHDSEITDFVDICLNECARLKKTSVGGIVLYKFLKTDNKNLVHLLREVPTSQTKKLYKYLKSDKVKAAFPNFVYMLRRKMILSSRK